MDRLRELIKKIYIIALWASNAFYVMITLCIINRADIYAFLYEVLIERQLRFLPFYEVLGLVTLIADIFFFDSDSLFYTVVRFIAISCIFMLMITIANFTFYTLKYNY